MIAFAMAAVAYLPLLWLACGGLPRREPRPVPVAVPVGRHARRWPPRSEMCDTGELAALYGREYLS